MRSKKVRKNLFLLKKIKESALTNFLPKSLSCMPISMIIRDQKWSWSILIFTKPYQASVPRFNLSERFNTSSTHSCWVFLFTIFFNVVFADVSKNNSSKAILNIDFIDNKSKLFELRISTAKITFEETFS